MSGQFGGMVQRRQPTARAMMDDPRARAVYKRETTAEGKRRFDMAVSDFFKGRDLLADGSPRE